MVTPAEIPGFAQTAFQAAIEPKSIFIAFAIQKAGREVPCTV
jgi:hypothetical protein